ncbi:MAG: hypothetical protein HN413_08035 [Chloroflexi bacterium]|nr:hypothetical protein [Chloroflexota bacterium]
MTRALNLDELFGQDKEISIDYRGKNYRLRHVREFGPAEYMKWQKLMDRYAALEGKEMLSPEEGVELQALVHDAVEQMNPRLADAEGVGFQQHVAILMHYAANIQVDVDEKKATE